MDGQIDQKIQNILSNNLPLNDMAGYDFKVVSTTDATTGDIYWISVLADAVFATILVNGSNCVASKGMTGVTIPAGTDLPFRKFHATSVTLTSGTVILYTT